MLQGALYIAIITRLSSKSFNITGPETLGLGPVDDVESPYHGRIPIPPLLDAQLDSLWMSKMGRIQKQVLSKLKNTVMSTDKRHNWFTIFLTVVVLLSNLEYVYQRQSEQVKRYPPSVGKSDLSVVSWTEEISFRMDTFQK